MDMSEEDRVGGCGAAVSLLPARGDDAGLFTPSLGVFFSVNLVV